MKIKYLLKMMLSIYVIIIACSIANAQIGFVAFGGDYSSSEGSVSQSAGVLTHTTAKNNSISVMQGIQHPFFITVVNTTNFIDDLELEIYPNPTTNHLQIKDVNGNFGIRNCRVFDTNGDVVLEQELNESLNTIYLENLPPATYYISLLGKDSYTFSYKIVKI